jgi:hypothetical protein
VDGEKTAHSAANDQESMLQIVDEEKETTSAPRLVTEADNLEGIVSL